MIMDKQISATTTFSVLLWVAGGALVILGGFGTLWFACIGLWISGIGGCLWIRGMMNRQSRREMTAFELGRQLERETTLRSV